MPLLILLVIFANLFAAQPCIDVSAPGKQPLHEGYVYLEDKSGTLNLDSILTDETQRLFRPLNGRSPGFGLTKSDYWIKISFVNPRADSVKRLLKFEYPLLDRVTLYRMKPDGTYTVHVSGDSVPVSLHGRGDENIVFPLMMQPHVKETVYAHIRSQSTMDLRLSLLDDDLYYTSEIAKNGILGFFYGGAVIMILYNFFLFLSIRERSYLYYVVFQMVTFLTLLSLSGLSLRYLWPESPQINNGAMIPFLIILAHILAIVFSRTFLETRITLPKLDRVLVWILYFSIIAMGLTLVLDYYRGIVLSVVVLFMTTLSLFTTGVIAYYGYRVRASKFYLGAWIFLLVGTTLTGMKNVGLLPITFFTTWGTNIGGFFELLLLSFGLADRINVIRSEKDRFQEESAQKARDLAEVLRKSKDELAQKVEERTAELSLTNQKLLTNVSAKESLLKELHHRVKNNLQVTISMMWLQRRRTKNEIARKIIDESTTRLRSMAMVHEMLYRSDNIVTVNMQEYLRSLIELCQLNTPEGGVEIDYRLQSLELDMDSAVTVGLICNEVLTNVFKHAFENRHGGNRLTVACEQSGEKIVVRIKDNGIGFGGLVPKNQSIGVILIHDLAEKLPGGRVTYKKYHGTYFRLEFMHETCISDR